jgi:YD repeat-containing protein
MGLGPSAVIGDADASGFLDGDQGVQTPVTGDGFANFAFEMWFKTDSTTSADSYLLQRPGPASGYGIELYLTAGRVETVVQQSGADPVRAISGGSYMDEEWHHVVVTRHEAYLLLYVDAQIVAAEVMFGPINWPIYPIFDETALGGHRPWIDTHQPDPHEALVGYVDEVAFYTHSLTPGQVASHYVAAGYAAPAPTAVPSRALFGGGSEGARWLHLCRRCAADPVDTFTGNFFHTFSDLALDARGPGVHVTRTYNAAPGGTLSDSAFGFGWSFPYGMRIDTAGASATVTQENGAELGFEYDNTEQEWAADPYVTSTLEDLGSTWRLVRNETDIAIFDKATGRLISLEDLNGYTTTLTYDGSGKLAQVTDSAGRAVTFAWSGDHIASIGDHVGRTVTYGYGPTATSPT